MTSGSGIVVRSLYRACLRLSLSLTREIGKTAGASVTTEVAKLHPTSLTERQTLSDCVKAEFRIHAAWSDPEDIDAEVLLT